MKDLNKKLVIFAHHGEKHVKVGKRFQEGSLCLLVTTNKLLFE